jgi:hypothetical protein
MSGSPPLSRSHRFAFSPLLSALTLAVILWGCNPKFTHTTLGSTPGTIVDLHGNSGLSALPASCQTSVPAFPPLPADWWAGVTPSVRAASAVTGYETWVATGLPAMCPAERRTDVYRAFFSTDLTPMAGKSGAVAKATAILTARANPAITAATIAASNAGMPNSNLCDGMSGAALQLQRQALAFPMPTGFTTNFISSGQFNPALPPIPNAYPNLTPPVLTLPNKNPGPASLGQPRFEADVTQLVVQALQAGVNKLNFMLVGTNEPPTLQEAPAVPQTDCKAIFSFNIDVETP